jgi:hypothetical protein
VLAVPGPTCGIGHELEVSAPGGEEVDPPLTQVRARTGGGLAQDLDADRTQIVDGDVDVVDVESEVVSADVAVAGSDGVLVRGDVLEDLEDGTSSTSKEAQVRDLRRRIDVEVLVHPCAPVDDRSQRVQVLTPQDLDQEASRLLDVRHCQPHMIEAGETWEAHAV